MMSGGIFFRDSSFAAKGFYAMSAIMLVSTTAGITTANGDTGESARLHNKLGNARTERLLAEVSEPEAA